MAKTEYDEPKLPVGQVLRLSENGLDPDCAAPMHYVWERMHFDQDYPSSCDYLASAANHAPAMARALKRLAEIEREIAVILGSDTGDDTVGSVAALEVERREILGRVE